MIGAVRLICLSGTLAGMSGSHREARRTIAQITLPLTACALASTAGSIAGDASANAAALIFITSGLDCESRRRPPEPSTGAAPPRPALAS
ncbi:hypothetical protein [Chenggangzhangella methanolivorans]|uniref:Uncharacterized protein n=1 Tax=Chenggangzhangella methanolivorans TaxID=1437009 RepID=A0A9E6R7Z9_9HYPH|nr:hypothetical protein [Chenggangzhangella methanolivorans]QZN98523.1 hypothetical protein K6K41_15900 [Chenggangzhangella methanolivorans]